MRRAPADPLVAGLFPGVTFDLEDAPESFFEQVGAMRVTSVFQPLGFLAPGAAGESARGWPGPRLPSGPWHDNRVSRG